MRGRDVGYAPGRWRRQRVDRPAFYALSPGGWRDLVTLLHPPYTAWHLSYVALGAAAAPTLHADRLVAALGAFFLGVGVCAHALDELNGRPLGTSSRPRARDRGPRLACRRDRRRHRRRLGDLVPFIAAGTFILVAYNLELFGGRFHTDFWFAASWGRFPALTAYWANALSIGWPACSSTAACFALSVAQRRLSTPVRTLRRRTIAVTGEQSLEDGTTVPLSAARVAAPLDAALRSLSFALVLLLLGGTSRGTAVGESHQPVRRLAGRTTSPFAGLAGEPQARSPAWRRTAFVSFSGARAAPSSVRPR